MTSPENPSSPAPSPSVRPWPTSTPPAASKIKPPEPPPPAPTEPVAPVPYRLAPPQGGLDLATAPTSEVVRRLLAVVAVEGPIHIEEAARRVAEGAGSKRLGARVQGAVDEAQAEAIEQGSIRLQGGFLWPSELTRPVVRDRAQLPSALRKPELLPPEEIEAAICSLVASSLGIPAFDLPAATCRLLGFPRLNDEIRTRVDDAVARLIEAKVLQTRGEHLVIESPAPDDPNPLRHPLPPSGTLER